MTGVTPSLRIIRARSLTDGDHSAAETAKTKRIENIEPTLLFEEYSLAADERRSYASTSDYRSLATSADYRTCSYASTSDLNTLDDDYSDDNSSMVTFDTMGYLQMFETGNEPRSSACEPLPSLLSGAMGKARTVADPFNTWCSVPSGNPGRLDDKAGLESPQSVGCHSNREEFVASTAFHISSRHEKTVLNGGSSSPVDTTGIPISQTTPSSSPKISTSSVDAKSATGAESQSPAKEEELEPSGSSTLINTCCIVPLCCAGRRSPENSDLVSSTDITDYTSFGHDDASGSPSSAHSDSLEELSEFQLQIQNRAREAEAESSAVALNCCSIEHLYSGSSDEVHAISSVSSMGEADGTTLQRRAPTDCRPTSPDEILLPEYEVQLSNVSSTTTNTTNDEANSPPTLLDVENESTLSERYVYGIRLPRTTSSRKPFARWAVFQSVRTVFSFRRLQKSSHGLQRTAET
jgi:hypothetical protein